MTGNMVIRIEFWNGHLDKKNQHVKTKHNPCLWSDIETENKPWRKVYVNALDVLKQWQNKILDDTNFLHHLRYIAYGIGKRDFNDTEVIWWGNLTKNHKPKLVVQNENEKFTIEFNYSNELEAWTTLTYNDVAEFYWNL